MGVERPAPRRNKISQGDISLKAIETRFRGYRMRSRLEARWATVFEYLGLDWQYEMEGFTNSQGQHWLPDFRLNLVGGEVLWVEIKPPGGNTPELEDKLYNFSRDWAEEGSDQNFWLIASEVPDPTEVEADRVSYFYDNGWWGSGGDHPHYFCVCDMCGAVGVQFDGRSARIKCGCRSCEIVAGAVDINTGDYEYDYVYKPISYRPYRVGDHHPDKVYTGDHPKVLAAYEAGRSARFEFADRGNRRRSCGSFDKMYRSRFHPSWGGTEF